MAVGDARVSRALARPALAAWDRVWFGEASLVRLGAFRIVMMSLALLAVYPQRMIVFQPAVRSGANEHATYWNPIYAFQILGVQPLAETAAHVVYAALLVAIVLGCVGLWSRISCAAAAALTFLWIGTKYSYGKPHHDCVALMFGLLALPLAPVGARLSIDSLIARVRRARRGEDPIVAPERAPCAALPWRFAQISAALGYMFAGASKLAIGGVTWVNGYTLQGMMLEYNAPWTALFARSAVLCSFMSIAVLIIQGTFPLVFLVHRLRWFYVPAAIVFHLVSWMTMDTGPYLTLWLTLTSFVALDRTPSFVRTHTTSGPLLARVAWALAMVGAAGTVLFLYFSQVPVWISLAILPLGAAVVLGFMDDAELDVVYDGGCGVCRTTAAWLAALDWSHRLRFRDLSQWNRVAAVHPALLREACLRDMHVVAKDGRVFVGYDAYCALARRLPLLVWFAPCMSLPGVKHAGRRIYRKIADRRWRTSCGFSAQHVESLARARGR